MRVFSACLASTEKLCESSPRITDYLAGGTPAAEHRGYIHNLIVQSPDQASTLCALGEILRTKHLRSKVESQSLDPGRDRADAADRALKTSRTQHFPSACGTMHRTGEDDKRLRIQRATGARKERQIESNAT